MERPLLQEHVVPAAGRQWWTWTALAATALVLSCLQLISIHRVGELQSAVAPLTLQLSPATEAVQLSHLKIKGKLLEKPGKYLIGGLTPPVDQGSRANCWLFAIVGVLEDSYRRQGIERGWLSEDMYLYLSRQSLGISIMDICKKHPSGLCPATTSADGSVIAWGNTTNWADEKLLWYLKELGTKALPGSVCPYTVSATGEKVCEGMEAALQTNPLEFKVKRADIFYDIPDMQRALIEKKRALTFSISVLKAEFFFPCTKATAKTYKGCDPEGDQCVPCPLTRAFVGIACCIPQTRAAVTMAGEWYHRPNGKQLVLGGHAINAVGYTDSYTDEWGNKGGLIVRNSWKDGLGFAHGATGHGSHSAAWYMREVSEKDEALVCPNPHSPRVWATCSSVEECVGAKAVLDAKQAHQPLNLTCSDNSNFVASGTVCVKGGTYFLSNLTEWDGDGLFIACFVGDGHPEVCAPPLLLDDLSSIMVPSKLEHINDPDVCGYNFISYATIEKTMSRIGGIAAGDFTVEWSRTSYESQKDFYTPTPRNYSLIAASTRKMPKTRIQAGGLWL